LSIQLPFALIPLVKFCSSSRIVGEAFVLKGRALKATNVLSGVIVCANVSLLLMTLFTSRYVNASFGGIVLGMTAVLFIIGYCYCIYWLLDQPVRQNLKSRIDQRLGLESSNFYNAAAESEIVGIIINNNNNNNNNEEEDDDDDEGDQVAMLRTQPSS